MLVGQQIGPFAVEKELGQGAMGTVYRARHLETGQRVAIKVMAPGVSSAAAQARFQRETAILKQLKHPNIVRLVASGKFHGSPFFAMEYVEGESLDHVLARRGRLTWEEVVDLGQHLCAGLQHAHEKGIVHRDLKPSNIMILADGTVKLTDFGIAKDLDVTQLTAANCTVGTASYMSPEQCRGDRDINNKSDLYSMGVMFYELLTGRKPFEAESTMDMFLKHTDGEFERPSRIVLDIPIWLDTLVCQLMEKKPDQRPLDAQTVGQALARVKEKVAAQQSAGLEAARTRKVDRTDLQPRLDEQDKEAARTLLHKKKRKKVLPFYRRGWFQAVTLGGMLVICTLIVYFGFLKTPGPESLLARGRQLFYSSDEADRKQVREDIIPTFLRNYPDHPEAATMRLWRDQIDRDIREKQMHNRRNLELPMNDDKAEELARRALDDEDAGKLKIAAASWKKLAEYKTKPEEDPDRPWGLVAEKYNQELQEVNNLYLKLKQQVMEEKKAAAKNKDKAKGSEKTGKEDTKESTSGEEKLALKAMALEQDGKIEEARENWRDLKENTKKKPELRRWFLLAARQVRELKSPPKNTK